MLLVTRIPLIVADVLVICLTWIKTWNQVREGRRLGMRIPLSTCILRDGEGNVARSEYLH